MGLLMMCFISGHLFAIDNPLNLRRACKSLNDSDVVLKWTVPTDTCNSFQSYYIYGRSGLVGPFDTIDSVKTLSQNQYIHKGAFLITNIWQYFIVLKYNCSGNPTLSSDTLSIDLTQTASQLIDSVSVDPLSGKYIIGWKTNTSKDLAGYKIYSVSGTNNIPIADLGNTTNQFTDNSSTPSTSTKTYSIAAYDSCNNITAIIDKHTAIKLSVSFDSCNHLFSFSWTGYIGFLVAKYQIFAVVNGGAPKNEKDFFSVSGPLNYVLSDNTINDGDLACFFVRAINSSNTAISSSSNIECIPVKFISLASINYISQVNIVNFTSANIDWITDKFNFISLAIFQQSTNGKNYYTRKSIKPLSNNYTFTADSLITDEIKYYFRIIILNTCLQFQDTSNICNSILLIPKKITKSINRIDWNSYLDFDAGVEKYEVYQGTGDASLGYSFILVKTLIPDSLSYTDLHFPDEILNDGVCYYVLAYEKSGNSYGVTSAISKSNIVCVPGDLLVFFPNAFHPGSNIEKNTRFIPKGLYIDYTKSWLKVYNRWGELVFETNNLLNGWDGNDANNNPCESGQYLFVSFVASLKDKNQNINGIISLIR